ncbi:transporter [Lithospermum erythrorhizon]|uniref:Transporter n=1 Tax=Lithospermum erythrorhizon TaxID=34254 RepID=A0AAV3QP42_LITER
MATPRLSIILEQVLSENANLRKSAELSLAQYNDTPEHMVRLLQIIADEKCDMAVRQVDSVHLKIVVANNWSCEQSKILSGDKLLVRDHILNCVVQVPHLLRYFSIKFSCLIAELSYPKHSKVQLGECVKTVIQSYYPQQWPGLLQFLDRNLQGQQVSGALFVEDSC